MLEGQARPASTPIGCRPLTPAREAREEMARAESILSLGGIVVMQRAGQVGLASLPARLYSNHEVDPWLKQLKLISPSAVRQ
jgi:hypothetical protein